MRKTFSTFLLAACALSLCLSLSATDARSARSYNKLVQVMAGKADTVDLSGPVADILVANPDIADVGTLRSNRLYIVGRKVGDTNVLVYDETGNQLANLTVSVRLDDANLQNSLKQFFPNERVTAHTVKDNVVLSGSVSTPSVASQVRDLAQRFLSDKSMTLVDLMSVRGEQQVMLKVKAIEAQRSVLRDLGIEGNARVGAIAPGLQYNGNDIGRVQDVPFGTASLLLGNNGKYSAILKALETNSLVNTLAEPNLTAISGETAGFLAGGEYPVPTGRDTSGNATIEFKQFGVSLNFTPTVLSKDRIALHLSTEVSEKDATNGVKLQDTQIDGLSVRRAETTVEMASGGTLMIAGLIKSDTLQSMNSLPGIQNVPILGELFKSKSFQRGESELVIIVTPYLVDPYADTNAVHESADAAPAPANLETTGAKKEDDAPKVKPALAPAADTGTSKPQKLLEKQASAAPIPPHPLTQKLLGNLRRTYGSSRMPDKVGDGAGIGYIVD